jgi:PAS domain S-box-containing protein
MKLFYRLSLRHKITAIILMTVMLIIAIGFGISANSEITSAREHMAAEMKLTADIISDYITADLTYNDKEAANESLAYLKNNTTILNAYIFDVTGSLFASLYNNSHDLSPDQLADKHQYFYENDELHINNPIYLDNKKIGTLYLIASTYNHSAIIQQRIITTSFITLALVVFSFFIASRLSRIITHPILSLTEAAKDLSKNYQINIPVESKYDDETGHLIGAFNLMLSKIKTREIERNQAEALLLASKEYLSLTLNNLAEGVLTVSKSGKIISINHPAQIMFGVSENSIIGHSASSLFEHLTIEDYIDTSKQNITPSKLDNIPTSIEITAKKSDQSTFPAAIKIGEMTDPSTNEICFIISCEDITIKNELDLQIRRSQKLDAIGQLTGGIAHDYNNMLGVIIGYTELLQLYLKDNPKLYNYTEEIHNAAIRSANLTSKLLSTSRHKKTEISEVNINTVLQNEKHMLEKTLTARVQLTWELADDLWPVKLDADDLVDTILNMSINAMHAMDLDGQLTFKTANKTIHPTADLKLHLPAGDYVTLSISDTGCGMSQEMIDKIFDPFYTTKGSKGTGLGLSQVYGFVERSHGTIRVSSKPGHGSRFILYFPRIQETAVTTSVSLENHQTQNLRGNETVLVVDDEPSMTELANEILTAQGYHVLIANDGEQALMILAQDTVDLIIADVIMPNMDGYQLISLARQHQPNIKSLVISGFSESHDENTAFCAAHKNILHKPYTAKALIEHVRRLLDEHN